MKVKIIAHVSVDDMSLEQAINLARLTVMNRDSNAVTKLYYIVPKLGKIIVSVTEADKALLGVTDSILAITNISEYPLERLPSTVIEYKELIIKVGNSLTDANILDVAQSLAEETATKVMPNKIPVVKVINYNTNAQDFLVLPSIFGANVFTNLSGIVNNGDSTNGDFIVANNGKTQEQVAEEERLAEEARLAEIKRLAKESLLTRLTNIDSIGMSEIIADTEALSTVVANLEAVKTMASNPMIMELLNNSAVAMDALYNSPLTIKKYFSRGSMYNGGLNYGTVKDGAGLFVRLTTKDGLHSYAEGSMKDEFLLFDGISVYHKCTAVSPYNQTALTASPRVHMRKFTTAIKSAVYNPIEVAYVSF